MNELMFLAILVVIFLGIFVGVALALIAPEELKKGRKYFMVLKTVLLLAMIGVMIYFKINLFLAALNVFLLTLFYLYGREYWILSFLLSVSAVNDKAFFIQSSLIFIYGLPEGSLFAEKIIKKKKTEIIFKAFTRYNLFLIFGIIMLLASMYT